MTAPPAADTSAAAPWLARPEWAARRIGDGARAGMWSLLAFATFWNAISWTVAIMALTRGSATGPARMVVLVFPLIGLVLAVAAARVVLKFFRYGVSVLELATLPAPPGRLLAGVVETRAVIAPDSGFRVRLSCLQIRVTGSGKNRTTREDILWQDERVIPGATRRQDGIGIPFAIPIPPDARETDNRDPRDRTVWRLTVDADVPGVDYSASFEVPVFRTAESATPLTPAEIAALDPEAESAAYELPADSVIALTRTQRGVELSFPAGHPPAGAWGLVAFTAIWSGCIYLMMRLDAPLVFPIVFGLFDLLLLLGVAQLFLLGSRVRAEPSGLVLSRAIAGIPLADRTLASGSIQRVEPEPGFRSGIDLTWDLAAWLHGNEKVILGRSIPSRREAEWLATELRNRLIPPA